MKKLRTSGATIAAILLFVGAAFSTDGHASEERWELECVGRLVIESPMETGLGFSGVFLGAKDRFESYPAKGLSGTGIGLGDLRVSKVIVDEVRVNNIPDDFIATASTLSTEQFRGSGERKRRSSSIIGTRTSHFRAWAAEDIYQVGRLIEEENIAIFIRGDRTAGTQKSPHLDNSGGSSAREPLNNAA